MRCPSCGSETSDMRPACEWCGVPLFGDVQGVRQGPPPGDAGQGAQGAQPPGYWQEQPGAGSPQQPAPEQPAYPPLYNPGAGAPSQPTWQEPPSGSRAPPPAGPYAGYGAGVPPAPGGYPAGGGPGYMAPGDASYRPPTPPELPRPVASGGGGEPIYLKPWPYIIAVLLVVLVVAGVFLTQKASNKTYADLVVGGRPTLLDFYTDT